MRFSSEEKSKLLDYVAINLTKSCNISFAEAQKIVNDSIIVQKIEDSPSFIAHCSMSQLLDMIKKDKHLVCV